MSATYSLETAIFHQEINREFSDIVIERLQYESDYILSVMEGVEYIYEAADASNKGTVKGVFSRMIEFIRRIFSAFTEKVKALVSGNKEWLEKNKAAFETLNYDGLQIEMMPFWKVNLKNTANELKRMIDSAITSNSPILKNEKYKSMDELKKGEFKEFLNEDGDLGAGAKNVFRTGESGDKAARPVTIGGADLKAQVTRDFHPYCTNYSTETFNAVKAVVDSITRKTEFIAGVADSKASEVRESFGEFDTTIFDSVRELFSPVLEAEGDNNQQAQQKSNAQPTNANQQNSSKPASPTKVTIQNNDNDASSEANNRVRGMSVDQTTVLKNYAQCVQVLAAALLTVAEERYTAYMNAMKQIISARKPAEPKAQPNAANSRVVKNK